MILDNVPKMVGMIYAVAALLILVYLFYKDKFTKKIGHVFLIISTLMGFLIFSPMIPVQLQQIILGDTAALGAPLVIALVGISLFFILTFLFGRLFCGFLCPIGAIQEIIYLLPTPKKKINMKKEFIIFRVIFFIILTVSALLFSMNILNYFGINAFFNLVFSSLLAVVFLVILIASIFVYRFFCRLFCPYAVFLSLASRISFVKFRRNSNCNDCNKCEKICPTSEAKSDDLKQECYLCFRCKEICPVDGIDYKINKKRSEKI